MKPLRRFPALALLAVSATLAFAAPSDLKIATRWPVSGDGGWDYPTADAATHRLYLSHNNGVDVLDLDKGTPVGRIEPATGVHGIAIAPGLGRGFVSCGRESCVLVFDLKTLATITKLPVAGRNPDAILYEPATKRVFTFNGGSSNATAFDAASGAALGAIPLGGKPEFAVADGHGRAWVNIEDQSELVEFDPAKLTVVRRWKVSPGEEPSGLAIDAAHERLFSVCGNGTLVVSDGAAGAVLTTLPIGHGVDGVAFDPKTGLVVSANGEGTATVIHEDSPAKFVVVATDSTERGARTITVDTATGRFFTPTASFGPAPEPTPERPHPRPSIVPGTFHVVVLSR